MAILIAYDDSDGWYDHVMPPIFNLSDDALVDTQCLGSIPAGAFNDRCGYGQRLPFLAISPYAKRNYVDHALIDTTSILRFIEDNWHLGRIDSLDNPDGTPEGNPLPGQGSFDRLAGSIEGMFDFDGQDHDHASRRLILNDVTDEISKRQ